MVLYFTVNYNLQLTSMYYVTNNFFLLYHKISIRKKWYFLKLIIIYEIFIRDIDALNIYANFQDK